MDLEQRFTAPRGWQWDYFFCENRKGDDHKIRYGFCHAANPKGLIVIAPGRTQTAEEYFELARDYLKQNFSIAVMDWQGQGGSYRIGGDNRRHTSNGFHDDVLDFEMFTEKLGAIDEFQKLPRVLFAHSMGGHLSLLYMLKHPESFDCAIMVAPMFGIKLGAITHFFADSVLATARFFNMSEHHALGQGEWSDLKHKITAPFISSDVARRDVQKYWFTKYPELRCGGVTYNWIDKALASCTALSANNDLQSLNIPMLFALGGKDMVVENKSTLNIADKLPLSEIKTYPESQHVIQAECDNIRKVLIKDCTRFVEKHLSL